MAIQIKGPSTLEFTVEPFTGATKMFLGRAVSKKPSEFQVEQIR